VEKVSSCTSVSRQADLLLVIISAKPGQVISLNFGSIRHRHRATHGTGQSWQQTTAKPAKSLPRRAILNIP
jgi:hypothetical protein